MLALKYSGRVIYFFRQFHHRVKVGKNKALYRTAGLIRSACIKTIRVSPNPSSPEKPVHSRTRGGIRLIRFSVSSMEDSAIIGPIKFAWSNKWDEPIPHIHEFGGTFASRFSYFATYPKRSYMGHTLDKLRRQGVIPRQFAASIARIL